MIQFEDLQSGLLLLLHWQTIPVILGGMILGLIIGVVPGMTAALGLAIILPLTLSLDALPALILMTSVYTGSLTGGGILAILINTPGTPGAVATTFDGYPLTRQGRHNTALGLQIVSSMIGGFFGYLFLLFFIQPMTWFALQFGSGEMLALTVFVIISIGFMDGNSIIRSVFAGTLGLLLATIGTSIVTDDIRGTFGIDALEDGLPLILCVIGLFAIPELISLTIRPALADAPATHSFRELLRGAGLAFRRVRVWMVGSTIGLVVGILPAAGATLASLSSYKLAKLMAEPGARFGEGEPDGVIAAESANNASEGGAMAILLCLGIPGSASTAVILGGFLLQGLVPGPRLMQDNAPLVYGLIASNLVQMMVLGFIATWVAFLVGRITSVPSRVLIPILLVVLAAGAYSFRKEIADVHILFAFGVIGWFFRRYQFSLLSMMIGLFLGRELDENFERVVILYGDAPLNALRSPITTALIVLSVLMVVVVIWRSMRQRLVPATKGNI